MSAHAAVERAAVGRAPGVRAEADREAVGPLGAVVDVFRLRQYFNAVLWAREMATGLRGDARFATAVLRAFLPMGGRPVAPSDPFAGLGRRRRPPEGGAGHRIALVATGGSGAMASVTGALRAFEELGLRPSLISLASGAALFGLPVAAGKPAAEVARFTLSLRPADYFDWDWGGLGRSLVELGRGFGGFLRGDRLEQAYRRFLGDRTLADLVIPAYLPIWNVEENRLEYLGPRTHPTLTVARAVRMAVSLPLFFDPVALDGGSWCDGGIVDILPVRPVLEIEPPSDAALVLNGFYPRGFAGERTGDWRGRPFSILELASQVRSAQHLQLARDNLELLRRALPVAEIVPVSYATVRGAGLYTHFLDTADWPAFMRQGRARALPALHELSRRAPVEKAAASEPRTRGGGLAALPLPARS